MGEPEPKGRREWAEAMRAAEAAVRDAEEAVRAAEDEVQDCVRQLHAALCLRGIAHE